MTTLRVVCIGHRAGASTVFWNPLESAGGTFSQLPFKTEQILEEISDEIANELLTAAQKGPSYFHGKLSFSDYSIPHVEITGSNARTQPREPLWCILTVVSGWRIKSRGRQFDLTSNVVWADGSKHYAIECANDMNRWLSGDIVHVAMPYSDAWDLRACELERNGN